MRIKATSLCAAVAALLLLAAAPVASAGGRLAGGTTTLSLDPAAVSALGSLGVGVTPIGPAKANGGGIAFPITGGDIHPSTAIGRIQHSGGLRLSAGGKRLDVTRFNVRIAGEAFLTANVGGARVKLLTLDTSKAKVGRKGFDTTVSGVGVALTGTAARALNATFGVRAFRTGLRLGTVKVDAAFAELLLAGGATTLALDPGAASALQSLGVTASPVDPASAGADGLSFPITKGRVDAKSLAGFVNHSGGIALRKGATRVELTSFRITIDDAPDLSAVLGGTRTEILSLDLSGAKTTIAGRDVTVGPVSAKLTKGAADALNGAFATTAFREGLVLGAATLRARGR